MDGLPWDVWSVIVRLCPLRLQLEYAVIPCWFMAYFVILASLNTLSTLRDAFDGSPLSLLSLMVPLSWSLCCTSKSFAKRTPTLINSIQSSNGALPRGIFHKLSQLDFLMLKNKQDSTEWLQELTCLTKLRVLSLINFTARLENLKQFSCSNYLLEIE